MKISLYGQSHYDRSGKIRWLLEELGVPYENHWIDSKKNDLEEGPYLKVNPLGRIPAIQFDDRPMIESGGISAYIADRYADLPKGKGLAPALTSPARLDYQQWMYFAVTIDGFASRISIIEDIPPGEVFESKMSSFLSEVKDAFELLDKTLSKKDFLVGEFSAADVCMGYHLYFVTLWPEMKALSDHYSHLSAYLERLKQREAAQKAKVFTFEG